jgi:uncharacterized protein
MQTIQKLPVSAWRVPVASLAVVLLLGVVFTAVRALAMLGPVSYRPLFLIHCVMMAVVPWLLFTRAGRREIGLKAPTHVGWVGLALLLGALASFICFATGYLLFGGSVGNWFMSVGESFRAQPTEGFSLLQLHLMFTIPGVLFSPIGEEFFFRGVLQRTLEDHISPARSTVVQAIWFAAAHLIHHGVIATATGFSFLFVSGPIWFLQMFGLSVMFAWLRRRSDSIVPAVISHSAFNATMNTFIFAYLW